VTILHNLNIAISAHLIEHFDSGIDFGVMEQIFNASTAFHNAVQMIKVGGYYLAALPANNTVGHGFYQFSPELFFSLLTEKNGMESPLLLAREMTPRGRFRIIPNPSDIGDRVLIESWREIYLFVASRKIASTPSSLDVNQFDYVLHWTQNTKLHSKTNQKSPVIQFLKPVVQKLPDFVLYIAERIFNARKERSLDRFPLWRPK
jgi:hypothetical protein